MCQLFVDWLELKYIKAPLKKVADFANKIFCERNMKHQCFNKFVKREISSTLKDKEDSVEVDKAKERLLVIEEAFSKCPFLGHEHDLDAKMIEGASMMRIFHEYYSTNKTFQID